MQTIKRKCLLCETIMTLGPRQGKTRYCRECARIVKRMQVNKSQRRCRELKKKRRRLAVTNPKPETRNSKPETLTRGGIRQAMVCAGLPGVRSLDGIMTARTKPPHMSDVRWRIELRRRANPGWYELLPESPCLPVGRPAPASDLGY
ncbi:MAG: hypothetical protein IJ146_03200 [Kiritimatiellae bacterium]|nr:hypothetical protein [Kiritimatiellia bacterium]